MIKDHDYSVASQMQSKMTYQYFKKGEVLFNFNETRTEFYVVIQGSVAVKVPVDTQIKAKDKNFKNWREFVGNDNTLCETYDELMTKEAYKLVSTEPDGTMVFSARLLQQVAELKDGASFGEQSIILKKPRNATIITTSDTHFAVLSAKEYDDIIGEIEKRKLSYLHLTNPYFCRKTERESIIHQKLRVHAPFDQAYHHEG